MGFSMKCLMANFEHLDEHCMKEKEKIIMHELNIEIPYITHLKISDGFIKLGIFLSSLIKDFAHGLKLPNVCRVHFEERTLLDEDVSYPRVLRPVTRDLD
jgi:hypothetical protein